MDNSLHKYNIQKKTYSVVILNLLLCLFSYLRVEKASRVKRMHGYISLTISHKILQDVYYFLILKTIINHRLFKKSFAKMLNIRIFIAIYQNY